MQVEEFETFQSRQQRGEETPPIASAMARAEELLKTIGSDIASDAEIFSELFGSIGSRLFVGSGFICDVGSNIKMGDNVSIGNNVVILDIGPVAIGNNVIIEDWVHIYNAFHRLRSDERWRFCCYALPGVIIEDNVVIGKHAVLLPGSVVLQDSIVPPGSVVSGVFPPLKPEKVNPDAISLYNNLRKSAGPANSQQSINKIRYLANRKNIIKKPVTTTFEHNLMGGNSGYGLINANNFFDSSFKIYIGNNCLIGPGCNFITNLHGFDNWPIDFHAGKTGKQPIGKLTGEISLGHNTWVAGKSTIFPGVSVGNNSVVLASNQIVGSDVPDNTILIVDNTGSQYIPL